MPAYIRNEKDEKVFRWAGKMAAISLTKSSTKYKNLSVDKENDWKRIKSLISRKKAWGLVTYFYKLKLSKQGRLPKGWKVKNSVEKLESYSSPISGASEKSLTKIRSVTAMSTGSRVELKARLTVASKFLKVAHVLRSDATASPEVVMRHYLGLGNNPAPDQATEDFITKPKHPASTDQFKVNSAFDRLLCDRLNSLTSNLEQNFEDGTTKSIYGRNFVYSSGKWVPVKKLSA